MSSSANSEIDIPVEEEEQQDQDQRQQELILMEHQEMIQPDEQQHHRFKQAASATEARTRFVAGHHQPAFLRQPSAVERAHDRWRKVKQHIEEKTEMKETTRRKWVNLTRSMSHGVAEFFGVAETPVDADYDHTMEKWRARARLLHCNSVLLGSRPPGAGRRKSPMSIRGVPSADDGLEMAPLSANVQGPMTHGGASGGASQSDVFDSLDGSGSGGGASMAEQWSRAKPAPHPIDPLRRPQRQISGVSVTSSGMRSMRSQQQQTYRHRQRDSVWRMTYDGVKALARGITMDERNATPPTPQLKSFPSQVATTQATGLAGAPTQAAFVPGPGEELTLDDVFFDMPPLTPPAQFRHSRSHPSKPHGQFFGASSGVGSTRGRGGGETAGLTLPGIREHGLSDVGSTADHKHVPVRMEALDDSTSNDVFESPVSEKLAALGPEFGAVEPKALDAAGFSSKEDESMEDEIDGVGVFTGARRIADRLIDATLLTTERREFGVGLVGNWLDRDIRMSRIDSNVEKQLSAITEYRPYFTYWVTFVQIVIFIFAICVYNFAYFGYSLRQINLEVFKTSLSYELSQHTEPENMWWGPRQADLIHMGAKYSPCMRRDINLQTVLDDYIEEEKQTACCVRNDGSGCVQTSRLQCSKTLSVWMSCNHNGTSNFDCGGRKSGTVCGHDPRFCKSPAPVGLGGDDITQWPLCMEPVDVVEGKHMTCKIIGRPCCIGIHGKCIRTTREHCEFRRGYFHSELTLCSQARCMSDVCGMMPFLYKDQPDQFYRLWTSLFVHAGVIQLLITVVFQAVIMRDLEKLAGWFRIGVIYIVSGVAGSLASSIFLPYHVEAGPAGAQFGLLACLFVEVLQSWQMLASPCWALGQLTIILVVLFVIGFLPWIDNYAHLVGFVFGFLLSFALLPHVTFNVMDKRGKKIGIVICLVASAGLLAILFTLFYVWPMYDCQSCQIFNCIPFTENFCRSADVNIQRDDEL